ncbi:MAG: hypothetical protein R3301_12255 [Saprospiraceae bacterium]|nr:hypothetical protein [Saprospiraceae bacterium]
MNDATPSPATYEQELTLSDLVGAVRLFVEAALRKWWLFALLFVLIGGFLIYRAYTHTPTYTARFTFMVNEDESGGLSGVASILGQFGIGARRGRYNLDKIVELSKSRRIIRETMFAQSNIGGKNDFLANHLLDTYEMVEKWEEDMPEFAGFRFRRDSVENFSELERAALVRVYRRLVGTENTQGLISSTYSEESSILTIAAETINEELSLDIVNHLFESLSEFYINQSIERQRVTYDILRAKVDSISGVLAGVESEYARIADQNRNVLLRSDRVREGQLSREIQKLNAIYIESLKNLEIADFALKNATPFIQEIDRPISPLRENRKSIIKAGLIGAFLALFIGALWIAGGLILARVLPTIEK